MDRDGGPRRRAAAVPGVASTPPARPAQPPAHPSGEPPSRQRRRAARAVTAAGGVPYHRLVVDGSHLPHMWWQPLVGTVLILVFGLVAVPLALMVVYVLPAELLGAAAAVELFPAFRAPLPGAVHRLLLLAALGPVVWRVAGWVRQRPAGSLVSVAGRVRWPWLAASLVPAVSAVLLTTVAGRLVTDAPGDVTARWPHWVGLPEFLLAAAVYVVLVPLAAAGVELSRGWVLQSAGAWLRRPWLPVALAAAALVVAERPAHLPGLLGALVTGGMLGWLVVRTGGVEAAVTYQAFSGLAAALLDAAVGYHARAIGVHGWLDLLFTVTQVLVFVRLTRAFLAYPPVAALLAPGRLPALQPAAATAGRGAATEETMSAGQAAGPQWAAGQTAGGELAAGRAAMARPAPAQEAGRMATASTSIR